MTPAGLADLITPNPDHVAIPVAEEDGGFRPQATLSVPCGPFSAVAADLNADWADGSVAGAKEEPYRQRAISDSVRWGHQSSSSPSGGEDNRSRRLFRPRPGP